MGARSCIRWNRVPAGPGRCLKPGSHCSHHMACLGPHVLPVQVTPGQTPCSALHSLPHVPLDPGLASCSHIHPRPGPWGHQDLLNCRVAEAAFGPRGVAEEINTINGENLDCDVEIWEGLGGHVTACPPAGGGEGRTQQGMSPAGELRGQSGPRGLAGQDWVKVQNEGDTLRKCRKARRENPRKSSTAKVCWGGEGAEERRAEGTGGQQELEEDAGMQKPRGQDG